MLCTHFVNSSSCRLLHPHLMGWMAVFVCHYSVNRLLWPLRVPCWFRVTPAWVNTGWCYSIDSSLRLQWWLWDPSEGNCSDGCQCTLWGHQKCLHSIRIYIHSLQKVKTWPHQFQDLCLKCNEWSQNNLSMILFSADRYRTDNLKLYLLQKANNDECTIFNGSFFFYKCCFPKE